MKIRCTVCEGTDRREIDTMLAHAIDYTTISQQYPTYSPKQISEHKCHVKLLSPKGNGYITQDKNTAKLLYSLKVGFAKLPGEKKRVLKTQKTPKYTGAGAGRGAGAGNFSTPPEQAEQEDSHQKVRTELAQRAYAQIESGPKPITPSQYSKRLVKMALEEKDRPMNFLVCVENVYELASRIVQLSEDLDVCDKIESYHRAGLLYKEVARLYETGVSKGLIESTDRGDINKLKKLFEMKPVILDYDDIQS